MSTVYAAILSQQAHQQAQAHVIEEHQFANGIFKRLIQRAGTYRIEIYRTAGSDLLHDYETPHADEAAAIYDGVDGIERTWDAAYLPRGASGDAGKTMAVYGVGSTIAQAIEGFVDGMGGRVESLAEVSEDPRHDEFQWSARVSTVEGASFKVAGRLVPGGAVVTWWK